MANERIGGILRANDIPPEGSGIEHEEIPRETALGTIAKGVKSGLRNAIFGGRTKGAQGIDEHGMQVTIVERSPGITGLLEGKIVRSVTIGPSPAEDKRRLARISNLMRAIEVKFDKGALSEQYINASTMSYDELIIYAQKLEINL